MQLTDVLEFVLIGALGIIGYFLRGIYADIKSMALTMQSMNERLIRHEEQNRVIAAKLERVEERIDAHEHDIRNLLITTKSLN